MPEPDPQAAGLSEPLLRLAQLAQEIKRTLASDRAAQAWEQTGGETRWRDHRLAILRHSQAYDLENERSDDAFAHWRQALDHWAGVHRDADFWAYLQAHVAEHMETAIDRGGVEGIRERLPYDLLAPHITLANLYRLNDPGRAARHMRLVADAPFAPDVVSAVREGAVRDVLARVPDCVENGQAEETLDSLRSWLRIDPTNPHLLRALLFVSRSSLELLLVDWADRTGLARIGESLRRVARPLEAATLDNGPAGDPTLAAELARYEYWQGIVVLDDAWREWNARPPEGSLTALDRVFVRAGEAALRFERALQLDSGIVVDGYYGDMPTFYLEAARLAAWSVVDRASDSKRAERWAAAECLQRALDLRPPGSDLDDALLDALINGQPEPGLRELLDTEGSPPGLEYWLGTAALREAQARFSPDAGQEELSAVVIAGGRAVRQFKNAARRVSPAPEDHLSHLRVALAAAETIAGRAVLHLEGRIEDNAMQVAAEHFRRAIESDPANFEPHLYLAGALAGGTGRPTRDFDEALHALREADRLVPSPAPPRFHETVADIRHRLGLRRNAR